MSIKDPNEWCSGSPHQVRINFKSGKTIEYTGWLKLDAFGTKIQSINWKTIEGFPLRILHINVEEIESISYIPM